MPLELMTMLGSGLLSGVMTLWGQSLKAKNEAHKRLVDRATINLRAHKEAREYNAPGFQFTRRTIALAAVGAIVVWPKVVPVLFPEIDVTIGWSEWNPGFLFFEGSNDVTWKAVKGLVLTPLDTHLMSAIIGLYFGASVVRNS